ncbi:hypothetical protein D4764_19G0002080 [Takifugu flavidus]|uniref:Serine/threonine-protein kinase 1 n=1 Tax=Takifugu flavidus TaxID=433684 RepID=A0A5C6NQI7_9TELE|nr:hypothetical protein D4764_19G0002080 [Takifugu flavidus]
MGISSNKRKREESSKSENSTSPTTSRGEDGRPVCKKRKVAIKHIDKDLVKYQPVVINGERRCVPMEMHGLMDDEVLLIMERPENCMNLFDYNNGQIDEGLAKEFMRQLVEAAIQIHKAAVFHHDLKPENILIQFYDAWHIPRVRISDFVVAGL